MAETFFSPGYLRLHTTARFFETPHDTQHLLNIASFELCANWKVLWSEDWRVYFCGKSQIAIRFDFLRLAEKSSTTVPLPPNWHMAWLNFLISDKWKEGTTCAQDKMDSPIKHNTRDRSAASLECRHSVSVPAAVMLEVPCYSYYLSLVCRQLQQPYYYHCTVFAKFERQAKPN